MLFLIARFMNLWPRRAGQVPGRLREWVGRKQWCTWGSLNHPSTCQSPVRIGDGGNSGENLFPTQLWAWPLREAGSVCFQAGVSFFFKMFYGQFTAGDEFLNLSTKKWKSVVRVLLRALQWASCVVKSTPTASLFASSLSPRRLSCLNKTLLVMCARNVWLQRTVLTCRGHKHIGQSGREINGIA